jgi:hypothetical protein
MGHRLAACNGATLRVATVILFTQELPTSGWTLEGHQDHAITRSMGSQTDRGVLSPRFREVLPW